MIVGVLPLCYGCDSKAREKAREDEEQLSKQRAMTEAARAQIQMLETALQIYKSEIGGWPTTFQGLSALRSVPDGLSDNSKWNGPYFKTDLPFDPWGQPYQYASPGIHNPDSYDLWSFGLDGQSGNEIGNWKSK